MPSTRSQQSLKFVYSLTFSMYLEFFLRNNLAQECHLWTRITVASLGSYPDSAVLFRTWLFRAPRFGS